MIDFQNKKVFKLSKGKEKNIPKDVTELLIPGEQIVGYYSSMRDYVVFTNKRLIACNVQGITGSKKDFTSLPYSKLQAFSNRNCWYIGHGCRTNSLLQRTRECEV